MFLVQKIMVTKKKLGLSDPSPHSGLSHKKDNFFDFLIAVNFDVCNGFFPKDALNALLEWLRRFFPVLHL